MTKLSDIIKATNAIYKSTIMAKSNWLIASSAVELMINSLQPKFVNGDIVVRNDSVCNAIAKVSYVEASNARWRMRVKRISNDKKINKRKGHWTWCNL